MGIRVDTCFDGKEKLLSKIVKIEMPLKLQETDQRVDRAPSCYWACHSGCVVDLTEEIW